MRVKEEIAHTDYTFGTIWEITKKMPSGYWPVMYACRFDRPTTVCRSYLIGYDVLYDAWTKACRKSGYRPIPLKWLRYYSRGWMSSETLRSEVDSRKFGSTRLTEE